MSLLLEGVILHGNLSALTPHFSGSFVKTGGGRNDVTFAVESVLVVKDVNGQTVKTAVHCAACMGEHTFDKNNLFIANSYEFTPVFWNDGSVTVFRDPSYYLGNRRTRSTNPLRTWGRPEIFIDWRRQTECERSSAIVSIETTALGGDAVEIHFPAKTVNVAPEGDVPFQVCTGPVIIPCDSGDIDLAFVCFTDSRIEIMRKSRMVPLEKRNPMLYKLLSWNAPLMRVLSVPWFCRPEKIDGKTVLIHN